MPVLELASVATSVTVSAILSLVLMVKAPLLRVLVLSPKAPSPLLSNCTAPVPLRVTGVVLSHATIWFRISCAVTVVVNATPAVCGVAAATV